MNRLLKFGTLALLAVALSACYEAQNLKYKVDANATTGDNLVAWVQLLTVDDNPGTNPDSPQDPAYLYKQSKAICGAVEYMEQLHGITDTNLRPAKVKGLCGPPGPDPVYPPKFPPPAEE